MPTHGDHCSDWASDHFEHSCWGLAQFRAKIGFPPFPLPYPRFSAGWTSPARVWGKSSLTWGLALAYRLDCCSLSLSSHFLFGVQPFIVTKHAQTLGLTMLLLWPLCARSPDLLPVTSEFCRCTQCYLSGTYNKIHYNSFPLSLAVADPEKGPLWPASYLFQNLVQNL